MIDNKPSEPAGQFCPECTCNNPLPATQCEVCGAPLRGRPAPRSPSLGIGRPAGTRLDAAGLLRAQGIAAEIAPPPIWGDPRPPAILASHLSRLKRRRALRTRPSSLPLTGDGTAGRLSAPGRRAFVGRERQGLGQECKHEASVHAGATMAAFLPWHDPQSTVSAAHFLDGHAIHRARAHRAIHLRLPAVVDHWHTSSPTFLNRHYAALDEYFSSGDTDRGSSAAGAAAQPGTRCLGRQSSSGYGRRKKVIFFPGRSVPGRSWPRGGDSAAGDRNRFFNVIGRLWARDDRGRCPIVRIRRLKRVARRPALLLASPSCLQPRLSASNP